MIDRVVIALACAAAVLGFLGFRGTTCGAAVLAAMLAWMYQDAALVLGAILFAVFLTINIPDRLRAAPKATRATQAPACDDSDAIDVEFEVVKER